MLLPSCAQPFQVAEQCSLFTGQPTGRIMCLIDHLGGTGEDRYIGCRFLQFYSQCRNVQAQSLGLIASLLVAFVCLPEYAKCGLELRVPAFYFADFPDLAQPVLHVLQILALLLKVFDLAIESFQFILKKLPLLMELLQRSMLLANAPGSPNTTRFPFPYPPIPQSSCPGIPLVCAS